METALSNSAQNLRGKLPAEDTEQMERLLEARWAERTRRRWIAWTR